MAELGIKSVIMSSSNTIEIPKVSKSNWVNEVHRCADCNTPLIAVPILECADCGKKHAMRAYVYQRGNLFIAECIDLDLLSQGKTEVEAISKLQEAMYGYLDVAFSGESIKGLVPRPSPLSHRFRFYMHRILGILGRSHRSRLVEIETNHQMCHS
jgi:hypothetical protein